MIAALVLAAFATLAPSGVVLTADDATALANDLADATEVQRICYGWDVTLYDQSSTPRQDDGSNLGPGVAVSGCDQSIEFVAIITYTSESSEAEDSASFSLRSTVPNGPSTQDLRDLGVDERSLISEDNDTVIANAVAALPRLAADRGVAPAVTFSPVTTAPTANIGGPANQPGSDFLREMGWPLTIGGFLLFAALVFAGWAIYRDRRSRRLQAVTSPPPAPAEPPTPPAPEEKPADAV